MDTTMRKWYYNLNVSTTTFYSSTEHSVVTQVRRFRIWNNV